MDDQMVSKSFESDTGIDLNKIDSILRGLDQDISESSYSTEDILSPNIKSKFNESDCTNKSSNIEINEVSSSISTFVLIYFIF